MTYSALNSALLSHNITCVPGNILARQTRPMHMKNTLHLDTCELVVLVCSQNDFCKQANKPYFEPYKYRPPFPSGVITVFHFSYQLSETRYEVVSNELC